MSQSLNVTIDPAHIDEDIADDTGYDAAMGARYDTEEGLFGIGAVSFPDRYWIEPRDWKERAEQNDENRTWPDDYKSHMTHQGNSHECTCHALSQVFEIAYNRQRALDMQVDKGKAVWFSPLSVYSEANPGQWGGSYMQKTLGIIRDRGILPEHNGPDNSGGIVVNQQKEEFTHTLNRTAGFSDPSRGGGPWVRMSRFPIGWRETAKHFKALEVINPRTYEEMVCLLLHGIALGVGRAGHAIPYVGLVWENGRTMYAKYSDSYDVFRYDSVSRMRSAVGGAYGIVTTTTPDDWDNPAG